MSDNISGLPIINTLELFPEVNRNLVELLESMSNEEWHKPTVLPGRTVKDLVSHILDGSLRRLSSCRDKYIADSPNIDTYQGLVDYIQKQNRDWITASRRLSPRILITCINLSKY